MRASVVCLFLLGLGLAASARVAPSVLRDAHESFISSPLNGAQSNFAAFWRGVVGRSRRESSDETDAYVAIRFVVPPSEADDFEDAWLDLEDEAYKEEKGLQILGLSKTKLDNLFYVAYGEWEQLRDLADHIESDHFQDFADFVDKRGIRWELQVLENRSEDVEEEQGLRGEERRDAILGRRKGEQREQDEDEDWDKNIPEEYRKYIPKKYRPGNKKSRRDEEVRVLFTYIVPPEAREDFEDDWEEAAFKTIKEDGNTVFSLRKVRADNTRYYGYGTWDSYEDLRDHVESKHVERLRDNLDDNDVITFITPLVRVEESSRRKQKK